MNKLLLAMVTIAISGAAWAKLPPPTEEAKAAAAAAKDKADWSNKVAAYQLCLSQDKVAAHYQKTTGAKKPAAEVPACVNPGPYVAATAAAPAASAPAPAPAPAKK